MHESHTLLGKFSPHALDFIIREASLIHETGARIEFISGYFLGIGYGESTLIGDENTAEVLVINLEVFDCMTFCEYVEAIRLSHFFGEFESNLKRVRYKSGVISFSNRNHFFTDWIDSNAGYISDVTKRIGMDEVIIVRKTLNLKEDGTYFLPGLPPVERDISYIPSKAIDDPVFDKLVTGNYVAIYSPKEGLDVSHVGIIIKDGENISFRHASSQKETRRVTDQDFKTYVRDKPGIIVFRPIPEYS